MLPNENENAAEIRTCFARYFVKCQEMLEFAQLSSTEFTCAAKNSPLNFLATTVLANMLVREGRKLRAIALLCERGFVNEGQQILRSTMDGALAARFVCVAPLANHLRPAGAQSPNFPPIPPGENAVNFRAFIYAGHELMQKDRGASNQQIQTIVPSTHLAAIQSEAQAFVAKVGTAWADRLGTPRGYSGLSTRDLLHNYDFGTFHLLFKDLSNKIHANDALSCISFDADGTPNLMWCGKDERSIPDILQLTVGFVADTFKSVLETVDLHDRGADAYRLAVEINNMK